MHDDDGDDGPHQLEPLTAAQLGQVHLVEEFALQAGIATTKSPDDELGASRVALLHLATRRNGTEDRDVVVVSLEAEQMLGLLGALVEFGVLLHGAEAITTIDSRLEKAMLDMVGLPES